jgi:hypothetical protein
VSRYLALPIAVSGTDDSEKMKGCGSNGWGLVFLFNVSYRNSIRAAGQHEQENAWQCSNALKWDWGLSGGPPRYGCHDLSAFDGH